MVKYKGKSTEELVEVIIKGLQEKKGLEIVKIDLQKVESSVCKYFVICNGTSSTHVTSLADEVVEYVQKSLNEKVWHKEGYQNAQWILLDYADVVVHLFQKEFRDFYQLEALWADAQITAIQEA